MLEISEVDEAGRLVATYLSSSKHDKNENRVDVLLAPDSLSLSQRFLSVFLPSGYPHSVTADYTPYQIYDSLQAFSSSIAGLLASRAVLQGIGVGDEDASATAAMLLSVLQESVGRIATILFAHWCSRSIEAECKMYRLAADIFNDTAMVLDCFSPMLPKPLRVPLFCASSIFRTMCGVAGGSSKAILSSHFAKADNIGELNAKDSSQETVISLLGMWAGGFALSSVTSTWATWACLLILLALHLSTNYAAVRSVTMRTLNRQRANITFSSILTNEKALTPAQTAQQEFIFETDGLLRWQGSQILGTCQIGVSLGELVRCTGAGTFTQAGSFKDLSIPLAQLVDIFVNEDYILWYNPDTRSAAIVLTEKATNQTQLKAWTHALQIAWNCSQPMEKRDTLSEQSVAGILEGTLKTHNEHFEHYLRELEIGGWNITAAALETKPGKRIRKDSLRLSEQP